jgi:hypothetical protein
VMVLSTNMAMIFPAIATETPSRNLEARIAESWRQMRGNFWLFVRASIVTFLPALILWVVIAIVMMIFALMVRGVIGHGLPLFPRLVLSGAIGVTVVLSIALAAALASWTYVWVRSDDQAQSAQTATSTVT